jgi:hypothetical protein
MDATSALGWFCYYGLYGPVEIDACIDLICEDIRGKVHKVRAPVEMLPDAAWISVEYCPDWPPEAGTRPEAIDTGRWITVWARGSSRPVSGPLWDALRERVRAVVLEVTG